ncbi:hypothetical protein EVAR_94704_1 [Eumeta japonica]|uniref:Uncharacterized protein n=1 Tax=Eumeta variegata TaxID=151549 RepID=A0A4C1UXN2_EUMVA|nr:hypothetical protein EVAR_94704_1 [Eumeta japonica]
MVLNSRGSEVGKGTSEPPATVWYKTPHHTAARPRRAIKLPFLPLILREEKEKWTRLITEWYPRVNKRYKGRQHKRWEDDIKQIAGAKWTRIARDRETWKSLEEAFVAGQAVTSNNPIADDIINLDVRRARERAAACRPKSTCSPDDIQIQKKHESLRKPTATRLAVRAAKSCRVQSKVAVVALLAPEAVGGVPGATFERICVTACVYGRWQVVVVWEPRFGARSHGTSSTTPALAPLNGDATMHTTATRTPSDVCGALDVRGARVCAVVKAADRVSDYDNYGQGFDYYRRP